MSAVKPPIGLTPKKVYDLECHERRILDILDAIKRYSEANMPIPAEWADELENRIIRYTGIAWRE